MVFLAKPGPGWRKHLSARARPRQAGERTRGPEHRGDLDLSRPHAIDDPKGTLDHLSNIAHLKLWNDPAGFREVGKALDRGDDAAYDEFRIRR